jgi:hypothetical protein
MMEVDKTINYSETLTRLLTNVTNGLSFGEEFHELLKHYEQLEKEKKHNGVTLECYVILLYSSYRLREVEILRGVYKVREF